MFFEDLAVPIFIPRYICAESALTISIGKVEANDKANSVLPAAVGPVKQGTNCFFDSLAR